MQNFTNITKRSKMSGTKLTQNKKISLALSMLIAPLSVFGADTQQNTQANSLDEFLLSLPNKKQILQQDDSMSETEILQNISKSLENSRGPIEMPVFNETTAAEPETNIEELNTSIDEFLPTEQIKDQPNTTQTNQSSQEISIEKLRVILRENNKIEEPLSTPRNAAQNAQMRDSVLQNIEITGKSTQTEYDIQEPQQNSVQRALEQERAKQNTITKQQLAQPQGASSTQKEPHKNQLIKIPEQSSNAKMSTQRMQGSLAPQPLSPLSEEQAEMQRIRGEQSEYDEEIKAAKAQATKPQLPRARVNNQALQSIKTPIVKNVIFENLNYISPLIAQEISNIKIGEPLDLAQVNKSVADFYKQGYFKDVWITEDNGVIIYHFIEKPTISSIIVDGYGSGKEAAAMDEDLGLKKGEVYDEVKIERMKKRLGLILEAQGFYDSIIEVETEEAGKNAIALKVKVNRGQEILLREVNYHGRKNISVSKIESVSANKERDLFIPWMWGFNDGILRSSELENDAARIRDLYMQKGYLDAQVSVPFLRADFTTYDATLDFYIEEGRQYIVSDIEIIQEDEVISDKKLYDEIRLKKGEIFNISKMRSDIEKIETAIGDLGYAFVRVNPDLDKDPQKGLVRVVYHIQPNKPVKIRDVVISGNNKSLDRVVRRNILLAPGDQYKMSQVKRSKEALMRTGNYDSVEVDQVRVDEESIDLLVDVKEGRTGEFSFGFGYGSYDGLMGSISLRERNLFGTGLTGGIYLDKSERNTSYRVSLLNPAIFDSDYNLGGELFRTEYDNYDYTQISQGGAFSVGRSFFDNLLDITLGYSYSRNRMTDFSNPYYELYYSDSNYTKGSIIPGFSFDNTDSYFFPNNGVRVTGSVEYAGVGGDAEFTKYYLSANLYKSIKDVTDIDLIFRYRAKGGFITERGYTPLDERFYLGGINSVRGYQSSSITPRDIYGVRLGGNKMFYNTVEMSYNPFETAQMRFTLFYDYGMIGRDKIDEEWRQSVGLGIEWVSPIGPITFVFPYPINPKDNDDTSRFEFMMGQRW